MKARSRLQPSPRTTGWRGSSGPSLRAHCAQEKVLKASNKRERTKNRTYRLGSHYSTHPNPLEHIARRILGFELAPSASNCFHNHTSTSCLHPHAHPIAFILKKSKSRLLCTDGGNHKSFFFLAPPMNS